MVKWKSEPWSTESHYDLLDSTRAAKKIKCTRDAARNKEVVIPSIEFIQKLSNHAVDWFLVSPGLTL